MHATTGLSDATNLKAFEAGIDNIDTSISSFSGTYGHTATESLISMLYNDKNNPYDMNLINKISDYFAEVRTKYKEHEGSLKGIDTKMLHNQVPGGMLSNFESQLKNMEMIDKLDLLIEEIPKIRKDLGYIPLVTPTSQIVGTQALLNIQNTNRYDALTNEMIDLSLNQTLGRTLVTSFTTLLVLFALFIFGGELIKGFSLALIIGVLVGTYSSIYVVANMLLGLSITQDDLAIPEPEGAEFDDMP